MDVAQRTISKIGNSYGVTIPLSMLEELDLQQGDKVQLKVVDGKIHLSKDKQISLPDGISPDFFEKVEETFSTYDVTIKGLKDR